MSAGAALSGNSKVKFTRLCYFHHRYSEPQSAVTLSRNRISPYCCLGKLKAEGTLDLFMEKRIQKTTKATDDEE